MTHYQLLGISPDAEQADIKPAYFAALRKYPPEQYPQEFKEVRYAYEVLSDEETRAQYDATLQMTQAEYAVYQRAKTHYDHDKLVEAIRVLTEGGEPASEPALSLLGDCYAENGNAQKAAKVFETLTARNPANVNFMIRLGECYAERGWEKKAEAALRRALEADESAEQGWLALVRLYGPTKPGAQALIDDALAACNRHHRPTLALLSFALIFAAINESPKMMDYVAQAAEQKTKSFYNDERWRQFGAETARFVMHYFLGRLQAEGPVDFVPLSAALEQAFSFLTEETCGDSFVEFQKMKTILALKADEKISEYMEDLLGAAASQDASALETANLELYCLQNLETHRAEIQYIKRTHPSAYAWKKSFFDRVLQTTNTDKLMEQYGAKMTRLVKQNPEEAQELFGDFDLPEKEVPFVHTEPKAGRNDPCPCGSGKKYKKCCGR